MKNKCSKSLDFSNLLDFSTLTLTCQIWQDLLDPAKFCQKCLSVKNSNVLKRQKVN